MNAETLDILIKLANEMEALVDSAIVQLEAYKQSEKELNDMGTES